MTVTAKKLFKGKTNNYYKAVAKSVGFQTQKRISYRDTLSHALAALTDHTFICFTIRVATLAHSKANM